MNVLLVSFQFEFSGKFSVALTTRNLILDKFSIRRKTEDFLFLLLQLLFLQEGVVFVNIGNSFEDQAVRREEPGADITLIDSIGLETGRCPRFRNLRQRCLTH